MRAGAGRDSALITVRQGLKESAKPPDRPPDRPRDRPPLLQPHPCGDLPSPNRCGLGLRTCVFKKRLPQSGGTAGVAGRALDVPAEPAGILAPRITCP